MNYVEGTTLLRNVPDLPGESLLSRITRMATANYLPSSQPIFASMGLHPSQNAHAIGVSEVQRVAAVLGLSRTATKAMTLHAFAEQIAAPHERYGTWLTPEFLGAIVAPLRYCPDCLAEQPYHRLVWEVKWLPLCLDHQCFLRDRCPHCQRKLSLMSLIHGQCQHCAGHLSKTPHESVADPQALAIGTLFKGWLQREEPTIPSSWHVPTAPSAVLLSLWVWLLRQRNSYSSYRSSYPVDAEDRLTIPLRRDAHRLFMNALHLQHWPTVFGAYIADAVRFDQFTNERLDSTWLEGIWHDPAYTLIQTVVEEVVLRQPPHRAWSFRLLQTDTSLQERFRVMYQQNLAAQHDVSPACILYLQHCNVIPHPEEAQRDDIPFCIRDQDQQATRWHEQAQEYLTVNEVSEWLDLDELMIQQCCADGLFGTVGADQIVRCSVEALLRTILAQARASQAQLPRWQPRLIPFYSIVKARGPLVPLLIRACMSGEITVWWQETASTSLGMLHVTLAEVESRYVQAVGWTSLQALAKQWRVSEMAVYNWVRCGLIPHVSPPWDARSITSWYLTPTAIQEFEGAYVSAEQLIAQFSQHHVRLQELVRSGVLKARWKPNSVSPSYWLYWRAAVMNVVSSLKLNASPPDPNGDEEHKEVKKR